MNEWSKQITTSLKEPVYLRQLEVRKRINPKTNKKYTLVDIIVAGLEAIGT